MRRPARRLSADEAALWAKVAKTVTPLNPPRHGEGDHAQDGGGDLRPAAAVRAERAPPPPPPLRVGGPPPRSGEDRRQARSQALDRHGLDASWDRKLSRGMVSPDFTLDLHGATLDAAHARLEMGVGQALAQGGRLMLLITGRARPQDDAGGRGERRGAIRRKFLDWLSAGPHASRIAAVRAAHPRHGGAGAVYIVLKRAR